MTTTALITATRVMFGNGKFDTDYRYIRAGGPTSLLPATRAFQSNAFQASAFGPGEAGTFAPAVTAFQANAFQSNAFGSKPLASFPMPKGETFQVDENANWVDWLWSDSVQSIGYQETSHSWATVTATKVTV